MGTQVERLNRLYTQALRLVQRVDVLEQGLDQLLPNDTSNEVLIELEYLLRMMAPGRWVSFRSRIQTPVDRRSTVWKSEVVDQDEPTEQGHPTLQDHDTTPPPGPEFVPEIAPESPLTPSPTVPDAPLWVPGVPRDRDEIPQGTDLLSQLRSGHTLKSTGASRPPPPPESAMLLALKENMEAKRNVPSDKRDRVKETTAVNMTGITPVQRKVPRATDHKNPPQEKSVTIFAEAKETPPPLAAPAVNRDHYIGIDLGSMDSRTSWIQANGSIETYYEHSLTELTKGLVWDKIDAQVKMHGIKRVLQRPENKALTPFILSKIFQRIKQRIKDETKHEPRFIDACVCLPTAFLKQHDEHVRFLCDGLMKAGCSAVELVTDTMALTLDWLSNPQDLGDFGEWYAANKEVDVCAIQLGAGYVSIALQQVTSSDIRQYDKYVDNLDVGGSLAGFCLAKYLTDLLTGQSNVEFEPSLDDLRIPLNPDLVYACHAMSYSLSSLGRTGHRLWSPWLFARLKLDPALHSDDKPIVDRFQELSAKNLAEPTIEQVNDVYEVLVQYIIDELLLRFEKEWKLPRIVLLGGGLSLAPVIRERIQEYFTHRHAREKSKSPPIVVTPKQGSDQGLIMAVRGAAKRANLGYGKRIAVFDPIRSVEIRALQQTTDSKQVPKPIESKTLAKAPTATVASVKAKSPPDAKAVSLASVAVPVPVPAKTAIPVQAKPPVGKVSQTLAALQSSTASAARPAVDPPGGPRGFDIGNWNSSESELQPRGIGKQLVAKNRVPTGGVGNIKVLLRQLTSAKEAFKNMLTTLARSKHKYRVPGSDILCLPNVWFEKTDEHTSTSTIAIQLAQEAGLSEPKALCDSTALALGYMWRNESWRSTPGARILAIQMGDAFVSAGMVMVKKAQPGRSAKEMEYKLERGKSEYEGTSMPVTDHWFVQQESKTTRGLSLGMSTVAHRLARRITAIVTGQTPAQYDEKQVLQADDGAGLSRQLIDACHSKIAIVLGVQNELTFRQKLITSEVLRTVPSYQHQDRYPFPIEPTLDMVTGYGGVDALVTAIWTLIKPLLETSLPQVIVLGGAPAKSKYIYGAVQNAVDEFVYARRAASAATATPLTVAPRESEPIHVVQASEADCCNGAAFVASQRVTLLL